MRTPRTLESPAVKLGAFAVVLALALAGGLVVGAAVGPEPSTSDDTSGHDGGHDDAAPDGERRPCRPGGQPGGYTLDLRTPVVDASDAGRTGARHRGPRRSPGHRLRRRARQGAAPRRRQPRPRRLRPRPPERDAAGTWTVTAPPLPPGSYRVYADFVPAGGDGLTLGADLAVPGDYRPAALPAPSTEADRRRLRRVVRRRARRRHGVRADRDRHPRRRSR